jgi:ABC-type uncharacterized transport system substrate-binding protein
MQIMVSFNQLEDYAKKYSDTRQHKELEVDAKDTAIKIIDSITSPDFSLPLQQQGLVSNGTMTYIYLNNLTYPYLFEFIAEILHTKIPIIVNDTSFGPGEIIVSKVDQKQAKDDLNSSIGELQKLVYAKKNKV